MEVSTDKIIESRLGLTFFSLPSQLCALVAPKTPQGVLVRGHAGIVINKLSPAWWCRGNAESNVGSSVVLFSKGC